MLCQACVSHSVHVGWVYPHMHLERGCIPVYNWAERVWTRGGVDGVYGQGVDRRYVDRAGVHRGCVYGGVDKGVYTPSRHTPLPPEEASELGRTHPTAMHSC